MHRLGNRARVLLHATDLPQSAKVRQTSEQSKARSGAGQSEYGVVLSCDNQPLISVNAGLMMQDQNGFACMSLPFPERSAYVQKSARGH